MQISSNIISNIYIYIRGLRNTSKFEEECLKHNYPKMKERGVLLISQKFIPPLFQHSGWNVFKFD